MSTSPSYSANARSWMVNAQLATNKIEDSRLREAFEVLPREVFVPEAFARTAYVDESIPLGDGRFMMEPMVLATLLQAAALTPADHVLHVGGNTGYGTAIIGQLAHSVVVVDEQRFVHGLPQKLIYAGCRNVTCVSALAQGAPQHAPYDVVVIEGAIEELPAELLAQLKEGGRMVYGQVLTAPPTTSNGMARLMMAQKQQGKLVQRALSEATMPRLPGFARAEQFVF